MIGQFSGQDVTSFIDRSSANTLTLDCVAWHWFSLVAFNLQFANMQLWFLLINFN